MADKFDQYVIGADPDQINWDQDKQLIYRPDMGPNPQALMTATGGASMSGPSPKYSQAQKPVQASNSVPESAKNRSAVAPKKKEMTADEMMKWADQMLAQIKSQEEAWKKAGPAVKVDQSQPAQLSGDMGPPIGGRMFGGTPARTDIPPELARAELAVATEPPMFAGKNKYGQKVTNPDFVRWDRAGNSDDGRTGRVRYPGGQTLTDTTLKDLMQPSDQPIDWDGLFMKEDMPEKGGMMKSNASKRVSVAARKAQK